MPRRSREQIGQYVLPSGVRSLTMEKVSSSTIWYSTYSSSRYSGSTLAGNPGCFWSRFNANNVNRTGALRCKDRNTSSSVYESFPPERQTITRSPSSIMEWSTTARPTKRLNFLLSLLCSTFAFAIAAPVCDRRYGIATPYTSIQRSRIPCIRTPGLYDYAATKYCGARLTDMPRRRAA